MNKSETIGKLSEALSKVQGVIEGAKKDSLNPYFKSSYADLSSVWEAIKKPLAENGLAVIQTGVLNAEHADVISIETTLTHTSGEWVSGIMSAKLTKTDPQSVGSCITYLRRYSLSAIVGVSPEDDDGESATREKTQQKSTSQETKATKEDVPIHLEELAEFKKKQSGDKFFELNKLCVQKGYTPKKGIETMKADEMVKFYNYLIALEDKKNG